MADNLLGGLLGYGNRLRSNLRGLLGDPVTYANEALGNALPSMEELAAQARQMGQTGQVPANVDPRIMDLGMGLLGAIKVYHGSPHKFTKASSEHIGKGEGAQAYGHGLYWAENPSVAKEYAVSAQPVKESYVREYPEKSGKFIAGLRRRGDNKFEDVGVFESEPAAWRAINEIRHGNTYEANLRWPDAAREAADPLGPHHFLDWDKPLKEQSESVLSSLRKSRNKTIKNALEKMNEPGTYSGEYLGGDSLVKLLSMNANGKQISPQASLALQKTGLPGITYLDAGSRAAGQGTRNYVTFDDALVELLKRNGISLAGQ